MNVQKNYEIHVLVNAKQEKLLCDNMTNIKSDLCDLNLINFKKMATITTTGVSQRQPMITCKIFNVDNRKAIDVSLTIKSVIEKYKITVVRTKVEMMIGQVNSDTLSLSVENDNYFESHIKIGKEIPSPEEYYKLADICLKYGTQLLINPDSDVIAPVTTFRSYDTSFANFLKDHNKMYQELETNGYLVFKVHLELGIYDTNVNTDQNWLFKDNYKEKIMEQDCPERMIAPKLLSVF